MKLNTDEITSVIKQEVENFATELEVSQVGQVIEVGDGIARIYGLENALMGEMIEFPGGVTGMVLNLEEDNVGIAVMGDATHIKEGDLVRRTGRIVEVPVRYQERVAGSSHFDSPLAFVPTAQAALLFRLRSR